MSAEPWFKFYPSDWLSGTSTLSAGERGVYITIVAAIYDEGGPIKRSDDRLARQCGLPKAGFVRALAALIDLGKIEENDGYICNARAKTEITERETRLSKNRLGAEISNSKRRGNSSDGTKTSVTDHVFDDAKTTVSELTHDEVTFEKNQDKSKIELRCTDRSTDEKEALRARVPEPEPDIEGFQPSIGAQDALDPDPADDPPAPEGPPPPAEKPSSPAKSRRSRQKSAIAPDQQPTESDRRAAAANDLDPATFRAEWARFRDHHLAHGSLMADWSAAWRTWLGNIGRFAPRSSQPPRAKSPSFAEIARRLEDESHESDIDFCQSKTDTTDAPNGGFTNRISRAAADDGLRVFDFG